MPCGLYQIVSIIYISIAWAVCLGLYGYLDVFVGYTPKYTCNVNSLLINNNSLVEKSNDECSYLVFDNTTNATYDCDSWTYDESYMKSTKITEYNLICKKNYVFETAYSVEQCGYVIGTLIFSIYADRIGRKPVFMITLTGMTILGFIQFFMKNFYAYTVLGFLINIFATGADSVCVTLTLELVSTSRRTLFGIGMGYVWVVVITFLSLLAYLISMWRFLCLSVFIILAIMALFSYWLVQESSTWLISVNKIDKASEVINWIAKFNCLTNSETYINQKKELDESFNRLKIYNKKYPKKSNQITIKQMFLEIIQYPKFRLYTIVMTLNYFVTALIYDGLQYLNADVGENIFINWTVLSIAEMPAQIICHIFLSRFGRRLSTSIYLIICGITLIIISITFTCKQHINSFWNCIFKDYFSFIDIKFDGLKLTLYMIAKIACTVAYSSVIIHAPEIFPTHLR